MTKPDILLVRKIYPPTMEALEREFTVHKLWMARDRDAFMKAIAHTVRGAVTMGPAGFTRAQMEALPKLEIIGCFGRGLTTIDIAAARERGIIVMNTPHSIAPVVADLAMGLLLAVMRRICEGDRYVRQGKWPDVPFPMATGLDGMTCGIVGLGDIGRHIARRIEPFGVSVCYQGPRRKSDVQYPYYSDVVSLARESDILMVSCPLQADTIDLVDAAALEALGSKGFLVNVARGPIVNERALIDALVNHRIAGAALDVYWDEPHVPPELMSLPNVVMSPHIGSSILDVREERHRNLLEDFRAHFSGKPISHPFA